MKTRDEVLIIVQMSQSQDLTLIRTFQLCHLTFLLAIYGKTQTAISCSTHQHRDVKLTGSDIMNRPIDDILLEDDVNAIQKFLHEREQILLLKDRAFKIKLMYEESLLQQCHLDSNPLDDKARLSSVHASASVNRDSYLHSIHSPSIDHSIDPSNNSHFPLRTPILSMSNILKRRYDEAEAQVVRGTEPFNALTEQIQLRIERLEDIVRNSYKPSITKIKEPQLFQNFILETRYKLDLWTLLLNTLRATLSI